MTVFILLMVLNVCSLSAKHVYVPNQLSWSSAQAYCRNTYTELAAINNQAESNRFHELYAHKSGWIGFYKDTSSPSGYSWSGGGYMEYTNWTSGYSNTYWSYYCCGYWAKTGWTVDSSYDDHPFFCLNLIIIKERKPWEEALEYCRENHNSLTSLTSAHQVGVAKREIQHDSVTEPVWIGLRFLGDRWMWVNKDPLDYQAWTVGEDEESGCVESRRCGALTKGGLWVSRDCQERLSFICD